MDTVLPLRTRNSALNTEVVCTKRLHRHSKPAHIPEEAISRRRPAARLSSHAKDRFRPRRLHLRRDIAGHPPLRVGVEDEPRSSGVQAEGVNKEQTDRTNHSQQRSIRTGGTI